MAFRDITVFIRADIKNLQSGLTGASSAVGKFDASLRKASGSSQTFGKAAGTARLQTDSFARGGGAAASQFDRLSGSLRRGSAVMQQISQASGMLGKSMAAIKTIAIQTIAAFAGFIAIHTMVRGITATFGAVKDTFLGFNKALNESMAIMGDVSDMMKGEMSDSAREMAKTSTFSHEEVAEGFYFLASAGFSAAEAVQLLPQVTAFAQAGMMDLDEATEMLVDTLAAFGLKGENVLETQTELVRITDELTQAAIDSNATIEEFAQALTNGAAPAARQLGKSSAETIAVLEAFAAQGIKGQTAGTQLTIVWRDLQRRAIENKQAFKEMGVAVFDSNGEMRNTADIVDDLSGLLGSMSDEQKKATLAQLGFQDRSVKSIIALQGTGDAIREYEKSLTSAGGKTQEVAKKQLESLANQLIILKNNLLDMSLTGIAKLTEFANFIGAKFGPAWGNLQVIFSDVAEAVTPIAKAIAGIGAGAFVATLTTMAAVLQSVSSIVRDNIGLFKVLGIALLALKAGPAIVGMMETAYLKLLYSVDGAASGMVGLAGQAGKAGEAVKKGFGSVSGQAAFTGALMVATALFMQYTAAMQDSRKAADEWVGSLDTGKVKDVLNDYEGLVSYYNDSLIPAQNAAAEENKELDDFAELWRDVGGAIQTVTPWTEDYIQQSKDRANASAEEADQLKESIANWKGIWKFVEQDMPGTTVKQLEDAATALDINIADSVKISDKDIVRVKEELATKLSGEGPGGDAYQSELLNLNTKDMDEILKTARDFGIEFTAAWDLPPEMVEALNDALRDTSDLASGLKPTAEAIDILSSSIEGASSAASYFGSTMTGSEADAVAGAMRAMFNDPEENVKNLTASFKSIVDPIKAMESAMIDLGGTSAVFDKIKTKHQEMADELNKDKEEGATLAVPGAVGAAEFTAGINEQVKAMEEYEENIAKIAKSAPGNSGLIIQALMDLGDEGIPLMKQYADDMTGEAGRANDALESIPESAQLSLDAFNEIMGAQMANLHSLFDNVGWLLETGAIDQTQAQMMLQSPEYAGAIAESAAILKKGDLMTPEERQKVSEFFKLMTEGSVLPDLSARMTGAFTTLKTEMGTAGADMSVVMSKLIKNLQLTDEEIAILDATANGGISQQLKTDLDGVNVSLKNSGRDLGFLGESFKNFDPDTASIAETTHYINLMNQAINGSASAMAALAFIDVGNKVRDAFSGVFQNADGNIYRSFANGSSEVHSAHIADKPRLFAEPETGGEAYIPLAKSKRARSMMILSEVAKMFGMGLAPVAYANGAIAGHQMRGATSAAAAGGTIRIIPVEVPVAQQTSYNFGDITAEDPVATVQFAQRQARRRNLVSINR